MPPFLVLPTIESPQGLTIGIASVAVDTVCVVLLPARRLPVLEALISRCVFDRVQRGLQFLECLFRLRVRILVRVQLFGQTFEVSGCLLFLHHLLEATLK